MIWVAKQLDKVAEISQRYLNDPSIPESSKKVFRDALATAQNIESRPNAERKHNLDQAFDVLCKAAHGAGLCRCKEARGELSSCELVSRQ